MFTYVILFIIIIVVSGVNSFYMTNKIMNIFIDKTNNIQPICDKKYIGAVITVLSIALLAIIFFITAYILTTIMLIILANM